MSFKCTYCGKERNITLLELKQNSFCNSCFDERANLFIHKHNIDENHFEFMGLKIDLDPSSKGNIH